MSVHPFPGNSKPSPKAIESAEKWIEKKREDHTRTTELRQNQYNSMVDAISEGFGSLGVSQVEIGDTVLHLKEQDLSLSRSTDEVALTSRLNQGHPLVVLRFFCAGSFYQDELVNFADQSLETLIDVELVKTLAPTAKIFGPTDPLPWPDLLRASSNPVSILMEKPEEFEALWPRLKEWVHTDWHNDIMQKAKFFHKAENVWTVEVDYHFAPDLSWRMAQKVQAEKQLETIEEGGDWDAFAQQELKKTIGSLIALEGHPDFGGLMSDLIEKIKPSLAQSMDGKKRLKKAEEKARQAEEHVYNGYSRYFVDFNKYTPAIPGDFFVAREATPPKSPKKKM